MKIRYFVIAILLLLTVCAFAAQQAKVIHLKAADQTEAKKLWADLQAAQKAWNEFNAKVEKEYVKAAKSDFGNGFEFSEDFSVIVPKAPKGTIYLETWPKSYGSTSMSKTYPFYL